MPPLLYFSKGFHFQIAFTLRSLAGWKSENVRILHTSHGKYNDPDVPSPSATTGRLHTARIGPTQPSNTSGHHWDNRIEHRPQINSRALVTCRVH